MQAIHNDADLDRALDRIDHLWGAMEGTPEARELSALVDLVEAYEDKHYPIGPPTPEEAAQFRREQETS